MAERDTDFFEVMVGQIAQNAWINVVVGKALRVLPETEFLKPGTKSGAKSAACASRLVCMKI